MMKKCQERRLGWENVGKGDSDDQGKCEEIDSDDGEKEDKEEKLSIFRQLKLFIREMLTNKSFEKRKGKLTKSC